MSGGKRQTIKHTLKVKDSVGLTKTKERDWQFLVEKIIHAVEFENSEIIETENNWNWRKLSIPTPLCWHNRHFFRIYSFFRSWWDTSTWRQY